jgi:predicted transcriptional regulator
LKERGWSISAIARHLGRDRKTVRSYLNGDRRPGVRVTVVVDPLGEFEPYVRARFALATSTMASSPGRPRPGPAAAGRVMGRR